ncbi:hypothetical protein ACROYT_G044049 [Oculina patagonica]
MGSLLPDTGEEMPLVPLSQSREMDQRRRAKALSRLSLQSLESDFYDAMAKEDEEEMVEKNNSLLSCDMQTLKFNPQTTVYRSSLQPGQKVTSQEERKVNPFKLHRVSLSGDVPKVKDILESEPDLNLLDKSGRTPVHNAILGRHVKIMEMLLEAGADTTILDESQSAPLHTAVRTRDESIVKAFLQRANSEVDIRGHNSRTALHIAADKDKVSICKLLIEHGASANCRDDDSMTPLTRAVEKGSRNAAEFFFEDGQQNVE